MLVHEDGEELHLLKAVPDWWLEEGKEIRVERAPTYFGEMSMTIRGAADGVQVELESAQAAGAREDRCALAAIPAALECPRGYGGRASAGPEAAVGFPQHRQTLQRLGRMRKRRTK